MIISTSLPKNILPNLANVVRLFLSLIIITSLTLIASQAALAKDDNRLTKSVSIAPTQVQKNTLIVGSEQDYPPFATGMTDATAGGFTVELWKAVAAEAGLKYSIRVRPFHELLEEFKEGKIDVLINLAHSDERDKFADFSVPHIVVHGAIFVRKGKTDIHTENDLTNKSIIVLSADLAHDYAVSKGWGKQLVLVDTAAEGMRLLSSGKHDAMLLSKLAGMQTLQKLELHNVEPLNVTVGFSQKFVFAVQKGQSDLLSQINEALAIINSNGLYSTLHEKWFGVYEVKPAGLRDFMPIIVLVLATAGYLLYRRQIEREEAEKKYRELYDSALDMFLSIDAKTGTIIDCNQTLLSITGYSREELIGHPQIVLYHADYIEIAQAEFQTLLARKEVHVVELQVLCKDGRKIDVSLTATAVCDKRGKVLYGRSSMQNITQRKQIEMAIVDSRNLLMAIIDTAPIRVFWKDRDLCYMGCNTPFAQDAGTLHPRDVIGKNDFEMPWASQAELYRTDDFAVIESGIAKLSYNEPQTTPNGQTMWLRTSKVPLKNHNGEIIGILGIYDDITERRQSEEKLRILSTAIEQSPVSVFITNVDANIEYVNQRFTEITGYSAQEVIGKNPRILQSGLTSVAKHQELWNTLTSGQVWHGELTNKRKNGEVYWEETHISPVKDEAGVMTHFVAAKVDVTQRKLIDDAIQQSEERFRFMLENSPIAVRITKAETGEVLFANQCYAELIDTGLNAMTGLNPRQFYANPQDYDEVLKLIKKGNRITNKLVELNIPKNDRKTKWTLASYLQLTYQNTPCVLGWFYDISDRKAIEEQVQRLAHYDLLTELPNRALFTDRLQQALAIAKRDKTNLACMFLDLDKFKPVNDTYGHSVGDSLLKGVAKRIQNCLRDSDTVARIGGDEFVVLLPIIETSQGALRVAEKIRHSLKQPFEVEGHILNIASCMGVAIYPEHGDEDTLLIKHADTAMYYAKTNGRDNVQLYQANMREMNK